MTLKDVVESSKKDEDSLSAKFGKFLIFLAVAVLIVGFIGSMVLFIYYNFLTEASVSKEDEGTMPIELILILVSFLISTLLVFIAMFILPRKSVTKQAARTYEVSVAFAAINYAETLNGRYLLAIKDPTDLTMLNSDGTIISKVHDSQNPGNIVDDHVQFQASKVGTPYNIDVSFGNFEGEVLIHTALCFCAW